MFYWKIVRSLTTAATSLHWIVSLESFAQLGSFLRPTLPGMATWMRSMWSWQQLFSDTLPGTNIAPENQWLENELSFWDVLFNFRCYVSFSVKSMEVAKFFRHLMSARWFWPAILLPPLPGGRVPPQRLLGSSGALWWKETFRQEFQCFTMFFFVFIFQVYILIYIYIYIS